jgi:hypothetical protein
MSHRVLILLINVKVCFMHCNFERDLYVAAET